jgi:hypothetical protein
MNERIKELWEKAEVWDSSDDGRGGLKILLSVEKFAEFIVRDCALTAGLMEHEGRKGIGAQILDNYGVEE